MNNVNIYSVDLSSFDFADALAGAGGNYARTYNVIRRAHSMLHPGLSCKCQHLDVIRWAIEHPEICQKTVGWGPKVKETLHEMHDRGPEFLKTLCRYTYFDRAGRVKRLAPRHRR